MSLPRSPEPQEPDRAPSSPPAGAAPLFRFPRPPWSRDENPRIARERLAALAGIPVVSEAPGARERAEPVPGDGYELERLELDLNELEPVPALLTRPLEVSPPFPIVLYSHSHGGRYDIGKRELILGREYIAEPPWAVALARRGIAALAIDAWGFGERSHTSEADLFKAFLWRGECLWGRMIHDGLRALDYLRGRADVDPKRIGVLGMSMGSTASWWLGALDPGVAAVADLFCLTDLHALLEARDLGRHGVYYYVPGLLRDFSTARINALIAPRPHLAIVGDRDPLTPRKGVEAIDEELREIYRARGAADRWILRRTPGGHHETPEARDIALRFLEEYL